MCLDAGINHEGNAEVAKGQWEFQIFGKGSKKAADEMWVARYILQRLAEKYGIDIEDSPACTKLNLSASSATGSLTEAHQSACRTVS
jgi:glutamine synthetase